MPKEYNARGERMYENAIKRENTKKNKKNKIKQDEKQNERNTIGRGCTLFSRKI